MFQSTADDLESRFKAMSIDRDTYIDSRLPRSSVRTSASPSWRRRTSPTYSDRAVTNGGPLFRSTRLQPTDALTDWRSRGHERLGSPRTRPVETVAPFPTAAYDVAESRSATSRHRRGRHQRSQSRRRQRRSDSSSSSSGSDDAYDGDDEDGSSDVDGARGSRRHQRAPSSSRHRRSHRSQPTQKESSSRLRHRRGHSRHHDPSATHDGRHHEGSDDDMDGVVSSHGSDGLTRDAYPTESRHAVRYVGANSIPGASRTRERRPVERLASPPTPAAADGSSSPALGHSTLMKLVEQQVRRSSRDCDALESPWSVTAADPPQPPPPENVSPVLPSAASRPSQLLEAIIHNIAFYRRCAAPAFIPPEVSLAFDEYLARGTSLLKFTKSGPPHHRFFTVRFLDLSHTKRPFERASRTYGDRVERQSPASCGLPEAVFCYYSSSRSKVIRRYFPLADLVQVIGNGDGHPFVQRLMTRSGVLKVGRSGPFNKYTRADYILQFKFRSHVSMNEETIAVQAPDPTIYLAWQVVADFFSRVGDVPVPS